jgi:hypothetical protein
VIDSARAGTTMVNEDYYYAQLNAALPTWSACAGTLLWKLGHSSVLHQSGTDRHAPCDSDYNACAW